MLQRLLGSTLAAGGLAACGGSGGGDAGPELTAPVVTPPAVPVTPASTTPVPGSGGRTVFEARAAGATGDGQTNDRDALRRVLAQAAAQPGSDVVLPAGQYWLGTARDGDDLLVLQGARDVRIFGAGATLVCRSLSGINQALVLRGTSDVTLLGLGFRDEGLDRNRDWQGAHAVALDGNVIGGVLRTRLGGCRFETMLSAVFANGQTYPVRDITLEGMDIRGGYYGLLFQNNGHVVRGSDVRFVDLRRSYFAYGVDDHVLNVDSGAHPSGSNEFLIKCYDRETANITITATCSGQRTGEALVVLEHEHSQGTGLIRNVRVSIDLAAAACDIGAIFLLRSYAATGTGQVEATTRSVWRDLSIDGVFDPCGRQVPWFVARSVPGTERTLVRVGPRVDPRLIPFPAPDGFDFVRTA